MVRGALSFRLDCQPAFNYAQDKHTTEIRAGGACFRSSKLSLGLATRIRLKRNGTGVSAEFTLREGQTAVFVLQEMAKGAGCGITLAEEEAEEPFRKTVEYWRRWLSKCTYKGRWREMVERSALALKLLTFEPSGAIVATPTCFFR